MKRDSKPPLVKEIDTSRQCGLWSVAGHTEEERSNMCSLAGDSLGQSECLELTLTASSTYYLLTVADLSPSVLQMKYVAQKETSSGLANHFVLLSQKCYELCFT